MGRLFEDYPTVEREYFEQTGIFPIMHTVVIRKELLAKHPELARNAYQAFCEAKDVAIKNYEHAKIFNNMDTMFPWFSDLIDKDIKALGKDWWPYGIEANRKAIVIILRYHHEQGITDWLYTIEDLFVPDLLNA